MTSYGTEYIRNTCYHRLLYSYPFVEGNKAKPRNAEVYRLGSAPQRGTAVLRYCLVLV